MGQLLFIPWLNPIPLGGLTPFIHSFDDGHLGCF